MRTLIAIIMLMTAAARGETLLNTWPAPKDVPASALFSLRVNNLPVFVHEAPVLFEIDKREGTLWTHKEDASRQMVAFAAFDFAGEVEVEVTPTKPFTSAVLLPSSAQISPRIEDGVIRFRLTEARPVHVLLDGDARQVLHLLISPPEEAVPAPDDPDVLYFAPGLHEVEDVIRLKSNQTLYVAGGAILRRKVPAGYEPKMHEKFNLPVYGLPVIVAKDASNVTIRGRGIIDYSGVPHLGALMVQADTCSKVLIDGLILVNAASWNVQIRQSTEVEVRHVKILAGRLNSDGINVVSSNHVQVRDCFARTHDDSFAVKAMVEGVPSHDILYERCQAWNDWGAACGVTYENRAPIHDVTFRDMELLSARNWLMAIHCSDSARVQRIRFERINVEDQHRMARRLVGTMPQLLHVTLQKGYWSTQAQAGHVNDVVVHDVRVIGTLPPTELRGWDHDHRVEGIRIEGLFLDDEPVEQHEAAINVKTHAAPVHFQPTP